MNKNTFLSLLSKEAAGTINEKEKVRLKNALAESPYFQSIYDEFKHYMAQKSVMNVNVEAKLEEIWQQIEKNVSIPTLSTIQKRIVPMWMKVAAALLILFGTGFSLMKIMHKPTENLYSQTIVSGNQTIFTVLEDGTQVWLNKNSVLTYNADFGKKKRQIKLIGEAFFDVKHNPAVPLTVNSQNVDVTVKGTAFNVNSYTQNKVEVALLRGLVAVKSNKEKEVLLYPNHKLVMQNGQKMSIDTIQNVIKTDTDTIPAVTKWTNNDLSFNKLRFEDIAKLMENRYKVSITIATVSLKEQRFTGTITDEKLTEMLDALKLSYPFEYKIEGKKVIIQAS